ncbi:MAG: helix-turn-helix transcriptional regulator [Deltaproteobacteria bacterium]|nr:helix-turn-helix transcriptional regulator [Deltaproteobacteria bacterium]
MRRIRDLATARHVPVSHLPDRAGVARSHFWDVMAGRKSPTLKWLAKIAATLDVDPAALLAAPKR